MVALLNLRLRNSPIVPTLRRMASVAPGMRAEADQTSLQEKVKAKQEAKQKADVPLGMCESCYVGNTSFNLPTYINRVEVYHRISFAV